MRGEGWGGVGAAGRRLSWQAQGARRGEFHMILGLLGAVPRVFSLPLFAFAAMQDPLC